MIIKTSPDEIQNYLVDASNVKGFCDAVYFPESTEDVIKILKEAYRNNTKVTVAGNGTGLAGACVPEGGIVISTERMNRIIEINHEKLTAVVQPGVILSDFLSMLKQLNILYPPDPTEKNCFIGGTVATNASGEKTFKYGPTRNYIRALEIVLPDGDLLQLKRGEPAALENTLILTTCSGRVIEISLPDIKMPQVKNASGYFILKNMDAIDLFIGSEGTLGVIIEIELRLLPKPEKIISCIIFFDSEQDGLTFISHARELSSLSRENKIPDAIDALALEYFDQGALRFLYDDYPQVPQNAKAAVWFEQEVNSENENILFDEWMNLVAQHNGDEETAWFALSENDMVKIQEFRHAISAKVNEHISRNNLKKLGTDVAVPDTNFEELYYFSKKIVGESGIQFVVYGHFGNSHMHLNMLPKNEMEYLAGKKLYGEICRKAIELNGTVSAEHGIGKLKREYLLEMYGEDAIMKMQQIKKIIDPHMIMGSGTMFL